MLNLILLLMLFFLLSPSLAMAQGVPSSRDFSKIIDNISRIETKSALEKTDFLGTSGDVDEEPKQARKPKKNIDARKDRQNCVEIDTIKIKGYEKTKHFPQGYRTLVGSCVSSSDLSSLLERLNRSYQDQGLISTRVYLPEQDLSKGTLEIIVIPGVSDGIEYQDSTNDRRITTAFPHKIGDVIFLRDLEHGLENINRVDSVKAEFKLYPGKKTGRSTIKISEDVSRPSHYSLKLDNLGTDAVGRYRAIVSFAYDNLARINDLFSIQYITNLDRKPKIDKGFSEEKGGVKHSHSLNIGYSFPIGYWTYEFSGSLSEYRFIVDGVNQNYKVSGNSASAKLGAKLLIFRDQTSKIFSSIVIETKRSRSFIESTEIASQRRRISLATLSFSGEHKSGTRTISWGASGSSTIGAFGHEDPLPKSIGEHFGYFKANIAFKEKILNKSLDFSTTLSGQKSHDKLTGSEKFAIGGSSTVRGFHEDSLISETGVYWSNNVSKKIIEGGSFELSANAGIDTGWINDFGVDYFSQDHLVGASIGLSGKYSHKLDFDFTWGRVLSRPREFKEGLNQYSFNIKAKF